MMRYQRVSSPDCHPLSNGRKPSLRACNEDAADAGDSTVRIPNYSSSFDAKPPRARSASGSASTTPDRPPFTHFTFPDSDAAAAGGSSNGGIGGSPSPAPKNVNGVCGGGVLLQWGHNKRSRGSRAEGRQVAAGDDSSSGGQSSRQVVKIQRRAAAAAAAAAASAAATAMPPPGASYTRGANLRPCTPGRDATSPLRNNRAVEERSGGQHKRAPPSPPEKPHPNGGGAADAAADRDPPPAGGAGGEKVNLEQFEWPRIFISLSRKEKEDDFMAMKGTKLPQRPKKRAKNVDKTLQYCFPGMWLSDLTRGRYEVREKKCVKKKRRGLKGMESMDSDSE